MQRAEGEWVREGESIKNNAVSCILGLSIKLYHNIYSLKSITTSVAVFSPWRVSFLYMYAIFMMLGPQRIRICLLHHSLHLNIANIKAHIKVWERVSLARQMNNKSLDFLVKYMSYNLDIKCNCREAECTFHGVQHFYG